MSVLNTENYKNFEALVAQTGSTYAFDEETSVKGFGLLFGIMNEMGLDPMKTADLKKGMTFLFNVETYNMPDLTNTRFIFTPNHVSDLDAPILGLLHPKIKIVAKNDWINNKKLRQFLDIHYNLDGIDRLSLQSLRVLLKSSISYFNNDNENKHFMVFSQGTISDFNNNGPERISSIAKKISEQTGVPIVNVFIEQASLYHPTRIVFGKPVTLAKNDDFRAFWLEGLKELQASLTPPARLPKLSYKHSNNNKPGEPFF